MKSWRKFSKDNYKQKKDKNRKKGSKKNKKIKQKKEKIEKKWLKKQANLERKMKKLQMHKENNARDIFDKEEQESKLLEKFQGKIHKLKNKMYSGRRRFDLKDSMKKEYDFKDSIKELDFKKDPENSKSNMVSEKNDEFNVSIPCYRLCCLLLMNTGCPARSESRK